MPLDAQCSRINTSTMFAMLRCSIREASRSASFRFGSIRRFKVAVFVATIVFHICCICNAFVPYFTLVEQPAV